MKKLFAGICLDLFDQGIPIIDVRLESLGKRNVIIGSLIDVFGIKDRGAGGKLVNKCRPVIG